MKAPDELTLAYLRKSQPVQWVAWHAAVEDAGAKAALDTILFDSATDSLRDLTAAPVRAAVADCVLRHQALTILVSREVSALAGAIQQLSPKDH